MYSSIFGKLGLDDLPTGSSNVERETNGNGGNNQDKDNFHGGEGLSDSA